MFQAVNALSGDGGGLRGLCGTKIQECWTFEHPRREAVLNEQGVIYRAFGVIELMACRSSNHEHPQYSECEAQLPHS